MKIINNSQHQSHRVLLASGHLVLGPGMEALLEALRFLVLQGAQQLSGTIRLLEAHVLQVHLEKLVVGVRII